MENDIYFVHKCKVEDDHIGSNLYELKKIESKDEIYHYISDEVFQDIDMTDYLDEKINITLNECDIYSSYSIFNDDMKLVFTIDNFESKTWKDFENFIFDIKNEQVILKFDNFKNVNVNKK
jgi:hypothetical protein